MARPKRDRDRKATEQASVNEAEQKIALDDLISVDTKFWKAKCLSPRRAVRLHYWLADIAGNLAGALGEPGEETDWPVLLGRLVGVLGENEFVEILSIASGHTAEEIEENFDYGEALDCLADFVEVNNLGGAVTNFFARIRKWLPGAEAPETPEIPEEAMRFHQEMKQAAS